MSSHQFQHWTKSSRSSAGDNCVQVAFADDGTVGIRDSKHPNRAVLEFTPAEYDAFVDGILNGELRRPTAS